MNERSGIMSTILDKIIKEKAHEVNRFKALDSLPKRTIPLYSFKNSLNKNTMNIISEIKRASPSKGMINEGVDPVKQAKAYEALGAKAISVLTDEPFFKGSMDDLKAVSAAVNIPVLCKDFMIDKIQIDVAKANGASMILLIVAALDDQTLHDLFAYATEAGLEVLVEVHNETEMKRALQLEAPIIGINNRDLKTFHVDLQTTGKIANLVKENTILVSESGIQVKDDVTKVAKLGAHAILVGETFMRTNDLEKDFTDFQVALPTPLGEQL